MQLAKLRLFIFSDAYRCQFRRMLCRPIASNSVHEVQGQRNALRRLFSRLETADFIYAECRHTIKESPGSLRIPPVDASMPSLRWPSAAFVVEDIATYSVIDYRIQLAPSGEGW